MIDRVVIDHTYSLQDGITEGRTNEFQTSLSFMTLIIFTLLFNSIFKIVTCAKNHFLFLFLFGYNMSSYF